MGWSYSYRILFIGPVRYIRIYLYVILFPVTITLLLSCYLVYTARTRSCTQPCRVQGRVDGLLCTQPRTRPAKHGRVYGPYTAVYTIVYTTVQMDEYTAMYGRCNGHETSGHAVTV